MRSLPYLLNLLRKIHFNLDYDCGTTSSGIRKACKNCSCGLAQELEQEEHTKAKETIKSSCGSVRIKNEINDFIFEVYLKIFSVT